MGENLDSEEMGVKKEIVPAGTVIHQEKPFVYVLSSKFRNECCDFCFKKGELSKCSGCRYVYYCGRLCQREGWDIHKLECKKLKKIAPRVLPDAARFLFRLIKTLENGGDTKKSYYTQKNYRTYKDLMSHYPNLKTDKRRMEHLSSLYGVLYEFMGSDSVPNSAELMGMYGRMCINSFNICNQELHNLGTGMYLGASVLDHSCKANALAVFEGTTIYIRTLETLPYLDWSKVFISYIDILARAFERQEELQSTYYFLCQCTLCLAPEAVSEMCGAACVNKDCNNSIYIPENNSKPLKCDKCKSIVPKSFTENFKEVLEFTEMNLAMMRDMNYLDVCKICLKKQDGVFYKDNVLHVKTLDRAFESCVDLQQFDDAVNYGLKLIEHYYKYYGKIHPLTGLLHLKLGKILIFKEKIQDASFHIKKSHEILKITHGVKSTLYKTEVIPLWQQCKVK